jgi:hypothetical protein
MIEEIQKVLDDLANHDLPPMDNIDEALDKISCELVYGQRIYWYFREDVEYAKEYAFDPEEDEDGNEIPVTDEQACSAVRQDPPYSGLCVPLPGQLVDGCDLDIDAVLVVIDRYPTEKCDPEAEWVALNRLLASPDLVEICARSDPTVRRCLCG